MSAVENLTPDEQAKLDAIPDQPKLEKKIINDRTHPNYGAIQQNIDFISKSIDLEKQLADFCREIDAWKPHNTEDLRRAWGDFKAAIDAVRRSVNIPVNLDEFAKNPDAAREVAHKITNGLMDAPIDPIAVAKTIVNKIIKPKFKKAKAKKGLRTVKNAELKKKISKVRVSKEARKKIEAYEAKTKATKKRKAK